MSEADVLAIAPSSKEFLFCLFVRLNRSSPPKKARTHDKLKKKVRDNLRLTLSLKTEEFAINKVVDISFPLISAAGEQL